MLERSVQCRSTVDSSTKATTPSSCRASRQSAHPIAVRVAFFSREPAFADKLANALLHIDAMRAKLRKYDFSFQKLNFANRVLLLERAEPAQLFTKQRFNSSHEQDLDCRRQLVEWRKPQKRFRLELGRLVQDSEFFAVPEDGDKSPRQSQRRLDDFAVRHRSKACAIVPLQEQVAPHDLVAEQPGCAQQRQLLVGAADLQFARSRARRISTLRFLSCSR
jgi:hypothetical protein